VQLLAIYLDNASSKESRPVGANIIEANDAAAAGCCVISIMRENTLLTSVDWSTYTCFNIFSMLLGSLNFCHLYQKKRLCVITVTKHLFCQSSKQNDWGWKIED
jgi:hypothetical protein